MKLSGNKILITGGASGIGLGLAERFLIENNTVIICGRRESLLKEITGRLPTIITRACDLSVPKEREELFDWISENHPDMNVLVNNAGIQQWLKISDDNFYQLAKHEISINIEAPIHLASLFSSLKSLGTIINVTSALSFVPLIKMPVYCATKAFLHSFTLSLRQLMKARNIEVIELIPPAVKTDLGGKGLHDYAPPVSDFIRSVFEQLAEGKTEVTFGYSESLSKGSAEDLQKAFIRMNQLG
jgi:uncharacterized oxidoreductase